MDKRAKIQNEGTKAIIDNNYRGIIDVSMRVGKTKLVIDALNHISKPKRVLIMAPQKTILKSWKEEVKKWNLEDHITVDYIWSNSIKKINKNYDLIIADECHCYNQSVLDYLRKHQIFGTRILGLTGTLDDVAAFNLENTLGLKTIYKYSFEQAIEDKIVADYHITCIGCYLDDTREIIQCGTKEKPFYQTETKAYKYWDNLYKDKVSKRNFSNLQFIGSKRLEIIYNSQTKLEKTLELVEEKERCLIFTGRQIIADKIGEASYHSKSNKNTLDKFKKEEINKMSAIGMVSLGVTFPNLKVAIFNQLKSVESLCIQQTFRVMSLEENKKAEIYITYLKGTQDEKWLKSAIGAFDKNKITFI